ncbi:MAG: hypothetical protein ACRYHQ_00765 [Janthinobacterium lividum]
MEQLLAELVHSLTILLPLGWRRLHPNLLFALDYLALGGLMILAAPLRAVARRLCISGSGGR